MINAQLPIDVRDTVQSVVRSQQNGPLIAAAAQLWIKSDDRVVDVTYGRGLFWAQYRPVDLTMHDLRLDGVDCRDLPEPDGSFDVVVFDPPYITVQSRGTNTIPDFYDRYGLADGMDGLGPATVGELYALLTAGMAEAYRVLTSGGRLMVKCMDFVTAGRFHPVRHHVVSAALEFGMEQVDEFIHFSGTGPGSWQNQIHSRRAHSFLCVFEKR